MIARIEGTLAAVENGTALVQVAGGLTYEVLLPAHTAARLSGEAGARVAFYTRHFLENQSQGAVMVPRLAGFERSADRDFFDLFTTCRGIGQRKALRAMAMPTDQIAAAIADRDVNLLKSLPEVGKRTAESVIAALNGRVDALVSAETYAGGGESEAPESHMAREGLEALLQLGEQRADAVRWIDQALSQEPEPAGVDELLERVYRLKAG